MIYTNTAGKMIGKLENNIFKKTVRKSKHLMKANNSWGLNDDVLQQLPNDIQIEIYDAEAGVTYSTTAEFFRENCTYLRFQNHGLQAFLALDKFQQMN